MRILLIMGLFVWLVSQASVVKAQQKEGPEDAKLSAAFRAYLDAWFPLEPLAAQWDRLVERAVYMLVLPGPVKVDLFPGEERREIEPSWEPTPANLAAVDTHFWDWTLWLGSKALHRRTDLVDEELRKLHHNLLGPLGVSDPPSTIDAAVTEYRRARDRLEHEWNISIGRELGDEVAGALERNGVIGRP